MKKTYIKSLSRFLLYTGIITQIIYIFITPFVEISAFILFATALLLTAGYLDISIAKKELEKDISNRELTWLKKRRNLQKYYSNEENLDKSFSECLKTIQLADSHNERISKILENYQTNNKKFKIKINRQSENRMDKYLHD